MSKRDLERHAVAEHRLVACALRQPPVAAAPEASAATTAMLARRSTH